MSTTYPQTTEHTLLLANVSADQLAQQHIKPRPLGDDEYIATLSTTSPGAPSYVIGQRVAGKAYDRIVMNYGSVAKPQKRVWQLSADRGAQVDYRIFDDSLSSGFLSVDR
ncbi:hypothetical protein L1277_001609 [Okibacterium sp. HSC-33S16]|uniref:hypothetical protein n=1 Tax=Okibacterium sp. HSC-33S16 TaxID=2910965 RepID=UPI00209F7B85|nr:hypothetical protein [Okibacterium sp. HSC-33S16]MCP2031518.1 hypothetical protein [Okibacterium sp. HSC-33S16]